MDHSPPSELPRQQRDELARRHLDSAEAWLRKIIHHQLYAKHGQDYLFKEPLVKKKKKKDYQTKTLEHHPRKFERDIDTTTFEQAISIITNPELYKEQFLNALGQAYPLGRDEARNFLNKLKDIRNDVSHGRGCSARQLEQAICYSNDLIDSIKEYFKSIGMNNLYNAPTIIRVLDNLGNESHLEDMPPRKAFRIIDWRQKGGKDLGDYPLDAGTTAC